MHGSQGGTAGYLKPFHLSLWARHSSKRLPGPLICTKSPAVLHTVDHRPVQRRLSSDSQSCFPAFVFQTKKSGGLCFGRTQRGSDSRAPHWKDACCAGYCHHPTPALVVLWSQIFRCLEDIVIRVGRVWGLWLNQTFILLACRRSHHCIYLLRRSFFFKFKAFCSNFFYFVAFNK